MMTNFCDMDYPPGDCIDLRTYLSTLIEAAADMPTIKYGEGSAAATSDDLDALWLPCDPPSCAIAVWLNTTADTYQIWSSISGTWRATGSASRNSPYYTEFEGVGGPIQEGWSGEWLLDGKGNVYPRPVLDGTELLLNNDFEDWSAGNLDDWTVTGTDTEENTIVHTGDASAYLTRVSATVTVEQAIAEAAARWYYGYIYVYLLYTVPANARFEITDGIKSYLSLSSPWYEWRKMSIATLIDTTPFTFKATMVDPIVVDPAFYIDTGSLNQITSGWCIYKEYYAATGTMYVDITLHAASEVMGILFNYQDDDNYGMVLIDQTNAYVYEVDTGTVTLNNSYAITYVDGGRLTVLRDSSDELTIDYDGTNLVTGLALATPNAATVHGIASPEALSFASAYGYIPE